MIVVKRQWRCHPNIIHLVELVGKTPGQLLSLAQYHFVLRFCVLPLIPGSYAATCVMSSRPLLILGPPYAPPLRPLDRGPFSGRRLGCLLGFRGIMANNLSGL